MVKNSFLILLQDFLLNMFYGEGNKIESEQDFEKRKFGSFGDCARMEYTGYDVLVDGTQEEVHDVLEFSEKWPWNLFGQMSTFVGS